MPDSNKCPLCDTNCSSHPLSGYHNVYEHDCPTCGTFLLHRVEWLQQQGQIDQRDRAKLSALLKERELKGLPPALLHAQEKDEPIPGSPSLRIGDLLSTWPEAVSERLDRALLNVSRLCTDIGQEVQLNYSQCSILMAFSKHEMMRIWQVFREDGLLEGGCTNTSLHGYITSIGWRRIEELTRRRDPAKDPVFVAMAFAPEVSTAYASAIEPAVKKAGYRVTRVDKEEHNEYIMDKILAMIRVAPFVVADFTMHRNGVYFEAGFAKGLGIPVISCCREDEFDKAHFDTKQLNHVLWKTPEEFHERLLNRILGGIGRGPIVSSSDD